ncbi:DNA photolyase family protein [Akkermansiaceae bacterium]|jgi:deoxyribodipyrimidine photo-lyase|nr:DNA photolyase family protein [Akkermansiaceae bacterium]
MPEKYRRVIHWFRRDLRLTDNTSLLEALSSSDEVVPLYILSDWSSDHLWTGAKRQQFLSDCLSSLSGNLEHLGGQLIIRQGDAVSELLRLVDEGEIDAIFYNEDVDPFGQAVEKQLKEKSPVPVHSFQDAALHGPTEILKGDGTPYRVYTPFSKRWLPVEKRAPAGRPKSIKTPHDLDSLPLPTLSTWDLEEGDWELPQGGEKAARERMKEALANRISSYDDTRDIPSVPGTSRLSQDLRWGTLSIRELYQKAAKQRSEQYLKELGWREFYFQILHHFPEVLSDEFNPDWRGLPWDEPGEQFEAWKSGQTGFPIIDAGIRELLKTGFMHNRVRMIVAMFLTKDLHIDWRLGEQFFAQHLLDGEIASNNGGWQWSAGTGADAAPYFRIQNPWSQTKRFDAKGEYIKRWVPELESVDPKKFQAPPEDGQTLAESYPAPILDHGEERKRTLEIFKKNRSQQK